MDVATNLGGALLSSTFSWLLSKLDSDDLSELFNSHKYVRKEVAKWRTLLPEIHAILEDAEQKQATNNLVKLFLGGLRDLALDMEDILDELELDAKRKLIASPKASITQKLTQKWVKDREIASQIKKITARLQHFEGKIRTLGLINSAVNVEASSSKAVAERSLDSAMPESHIVGRGNDKEKIFQMFDDEGNHEGYSVIPIVGMGGLGKTTLAGLVYDDDDEKLKDYGFELKAWVCVSDVFDVDQITRVILRKITGKKYDAEDLFSLQQDLKKELSGKKFLLVLDDIWNEKYREWDVLQRPFSQGAPGSKIIVTTRSMVVAKTMRADDKVYNLDLLPEDECLSLFARHALDKDNFDSHPELEGVGREIVEKCKGLPLAVKVLGGLLRGKPYHQEWEDLLNRELCNLPEGQSGISAVLKLSYNRLPPHLKTCFSFCAIFPKDYEFDKNELVLLWMAQGFLQQPSQGMQQMHDRGHQCFNDLLSRSIFQPSIRDRSQFMMHDFISDLAQEVAGEICCSLDQLSLGDNKARHLSFTPFVYNVLKRFEVLNKKKTLRTLLRLKGYHTYHYMVKEVVVGILPQLMCLRVLSLGGVQELPNSIGDLKHLRYIDLSYSSIQSLPESVGSLLFLQTLILHDCRGLTRLPATIGNLIDLHYLDITDTPSLTEIPLDVAKLKSLVLLPKFILGKADSGLRLKELKNLTGLQGANIANLAHLRRLSISWCPLLTSVTVELKSLVELSVWSCPNFKLFLSGQLPATLKNLNIARCENLESLPEGLMDDSNGDNMLQLEELSLWDIATRNLFPSGLLPLDHMSSLSTLTYLEINQVEGLESFPESGLGMPNLKYLHISDCKNLRSLPNRMHNLTSLQSLSISSCQRIESIPEGGLPTSLTFLNIGCENLKQPIKEWGLHRLTSLERFHIGWICPPGDLLPPSLVFFWIYQVKNLRSLSRELLQNLNSLQILKINDCSELQFLPKEGLPSSLGSLRIHNCPRLAQRLKEKQDYRRLIAHIPCVKID
ncbi:hypothetical protein SLE2022_131440 [Rubroshorea leprosula]